MPQEQRPCPWCGKMLDMAEYWDLGHGEETKSACDHCEKPIVVGMSREWDVDRGTE